MKKAIFFLLFPLAVFGQNFNGKVEFQNFANNGPNIRGTLANFLDQTNTYFANQVDTFCIAWDNIGRRYQVKAVISSTLTSAVVDLRRLDAGSHFPSGVGALFRPTPGGLVQIPTSNAAGISSQLAWRMANFNSAQSGSGVSTRISNPVFYNVCNDTCQYKTITSAFQAINEQVRPNDTVGVSAVIRIVKNGNGTHYTFNNGLYATSGNYRHIEITSTDTIYYTGTQTAFFADRCIPYRLNNIILKSTTNSGTGVRYDYCHVLATGLRIFNFATGLLISRTSGNFTSIVVQGNLGTGVSLSAASNCYLTGSITNYPTGLRLVSSSALVQLFTITNSTASVVVEQGSSLYGLSLTGTTLNFATLNGGSTVYLSPSCAFTSCNIPYNTVTDRGVVYYEGRTFRRILSSSTTLSKSQISDSKEHRIFASLASGASDNLIITLPNPDADFRYTNILVYANNLSTRNISITTPTNTILNQNGIASNSIILTPNKSTIIYALESSTGVWHWTTDKSIIEDKINLLDSLSIGGATNDQVLSYKNGKFRPETLNFLKINQAGQVVITVCNSGCEFNSINAALQKASTLLNPYDSTITSSIIIEFRTNSDGSKPTFSKGAVVTQGDFGKITIKSRDTVIYTGSGNFLDFKNCIPPQIVSLEARGKNNNAILFAYFNNSGICIIDSVYADSFRIFCRSNVCQFLFRNCTFLNARGSNGTSVWLETVSARVENCIIRNSQQGLFRAIRSCNIAFMFTTMTNNLGSNQIFRGMSGSFAFGNNMVFDSLTFINNNYHGNTADIDFVVTESSTIFPPNRKIFTQINKRTFYNTDTTSIFTTKGFLNLPSNFFAPGSYIKIKAYGTYKVNGTSSSISLSANFDNSPVRSDGTIGSSEILTNQPFYFESVITCLSSGATGSFAATSETTYYTSSNTFVKLSSPTNNFTRNTGLITGVSVSGFVSSAHPNSGFECDLIIIELENKKYSE